MIERIKNILVNSKQEWQVIAEEKKSIAELYTSYILWLAAIGPLASIIGMSLLGVRVPLVGIYRVPLGTAIVQAVVSYALMLLGIGILAYVIDFLAPNFAGEKNLIQAFKVATYSATASFLGGIFSIWPALGILGLLAGFYSIYLLYLGLPLLMKVPQEKALIYTIAVILITVVIYIILGALSSFIIPYPGSIKPMGY